MKKKIIILTAFIGLVLSACSDFLDRQPLTMPENEGFLAGREQVENYLNALYTSLPAPTQYGMSVRGEEVNSDNILAEKYDRRLNGENNQFSGSTDWEKAIRTCVMSTTSFTIIKLMQDLRLLKYSRLEEKPIFCVLIGISTCSPVLEIYL